MSQARARSLQTAKSLFYLKVRSGTNTSGSYCSDSSLKALSFAIKFSTLDSAAIDECQNPNGFYRETSLGFQRIFCGVGGNISRNRQCSGTRYLIVNRSYSGMVNSQVSSSTQPNEKSDEAGKGRKLLEKLDSFCKDLKLKEAVQILGLLEQQNVPVDIPRYLLLMNSCGESQALEEAKHVHNHLTRWVPHLDIHIQNKILEMYSKCGSMEDAFEVFDKMPQRNFTSWDTMITWFAKNGQGEEALDLFTEFKRVGLKPNNQMFRSVFTACSILGDTREGLLHFESMMKNYNIVPSMDDYLSVVDMLASAGHLNEAFEFIGKMPIEPSVDIWETMMNLSRVHGDLKLGNRCAELVDLLEPSRLNKHSKAGLVPIKQSKRLLRFNPLEIISEVKEFRHADTSHPDHEKLYNGLCCLEQHMREIGYVPYTRDMLFDVDRESKEEGLQLHSVKLALIHALLTTQPRAPLRILNNFRICRDCHNALKIISKLLGRRIISRDERRFHHFEKGVCSCNDFW